MNDDQRVFELQTEVQTLKQCIRDLIATLKNSNTMTAMDGDPHEHDHQMFDDVDKRSFDEILIRIG